ncbi:hypothetical protein [Actinopolymorpha pittospori]|uniref:Uncharacterized protein n=1 Tax=Actinopolymorpha pittospori TaxID=648752 RepID=A0A927MNW9_9ACTN|nr:hypothetical protein [Actinopolymorpha pittospori]MBE1604160.1 hypothetical protein [Actinopolymorpha pittospori]
MTLAGRRPFRVTARRMIRLGPHRFSAAVRIKLIIIATTTREIA